MNGFVYYSPTKILFGKDMEWEVGREIAAQGGSRVLLVYGGGSARKSGLLDRVESALADEGISFWCLGNVQPNPLLERVYDGIELIREKKIDFVLAVGGGSVIDTAKAAALGAEYKGDVWDYYEHLAEPKKMLPVGCILTLPASGSESSQASVITSQKNGGMKKGLNHPILRPKFAILNPELTYTLPAYQTACGVVDIMMHTLERYLSYGWDNEITDNIAESLLRTVIKYAPIALKQGDDYQARSELMWCGSLSHCDLTGLGMPGDWAVHQIEHELSTEYQVAHGAGLAAVWGSWANYTLDAGERRFARYARNVWKIAESEDRKAAEAGIQATEGFFAGLGMPISVSQLIGRKMTQEEITKLARKCTFGGKRTIGNLIVMKEPQIEKIYQLANH